CECQKQFCEGHLFSLSFERHVQSIVVLEFVTSVSVVATDADSHLCGGLTKPSLEGGLAKSCVIARNQCPFTDFRSPVKRAWISDDFSMIVERGQSPPYQFIQAELLGSSNLDNT